MDAIDRKILAVIQQDASLSVAEIGQRVGLSSTPCWKRIQRLEADGIILKRVALVDQDRVGLGVLGLGQTLLKLGDRPVLQLGGAAQIGVALRALKLLARVLELLLNLGDRTE